MGADPYAWHRERNGELLDQETAAVEILDVLRPTVAVARYAWARGRRSGR